MRSLILNDHLTQSPLAWPSGWNRTLNPITSRFGKWNNKVSIAKAADFVLEELARMAIPEYKVIISTNLRYRNDGRPYSNQKEPDDKGVAVWWMDERQQKVIALDQYDRIADNLYAIGKTIQAMRSIERWGGSEILNRTFTGFTALPDNSKMTWREVLKYCGDSLAGATDAYRKARSCAHPDTGGSDQLFKDVQEAWEQAKLHFGNSK